MAPRMRLGFFVAATLAAVVLVPGLALADTSSDYLVWSNTYGTDSPHGGYTTTTAKCGVCHSVHKASPAGEMLLRSTGEDSCVYCHITTNIGLVQIYDGDPDLYFNDNKNNHSLDGGAACNGCHAVHGADTYGGGIARKILKRLPIQPEFVSFFSATDDPEDLYGATADEMYPLPPYDFENWYNAKSVQQTAFCTGCHPYFTRASEDAITTDRMIVDGAISTDTTSFASHPMKRYWSETGDPDFQASGSTLPPGTQVAGMSTNGCFRCHGEGDYQDLGVGTHESSFPHYTATRQRFLMSGDEAGNILPDTEDSEQDGTCLYCHVWSNGVDMEGVGSTY